MPAPVAERCATVLGNRMWARLLTCGPIANRPNSFGGRLHSLRTPLSRLWPVEKFAADQFGGPPIEFQDWATSNMDTVSEIEGTGESRHYRSRKTWLSWTCNSCGACWRWTLILLSPFRAAARSQASCIRNHVSSVLPNAFVSRIAISGLTLCANMTETS